MSRRTLALEGRRCLDQRCGQRLTLEDVASVLLLARSRVSLVELTVSEEMGAECMPGVLDLYSRTLKERGWLRELPLFLRYGALRDSRMVVCKRTSPRRTSRTRVSAGRAENHTSVKTSLIRYFEPIPRGVTALKAALAINTKRRGKIISNSIYFFPSAFSLSFASCFS